MRAHILIFLLGYCLFLSNLIGEDQFQEFKVKRKNVFEFTKKPELKTEKDATTISFAVKDYCDVTVAIENAEGKILRHLASGVLGEKAPSPLQKKSLEQTIIWDNKDDSGKYIDNLAEMKVRVSLGLQAEYEKDLYYSPYLRISTLPVICMAPEGLYIYEGTGRDHVRLFDHDGNYIKTIYPFPASQIKNIQSLKWSKAPDGSDILLKESMYHQTLLTSGPNSGGGKNTRNMEAVSSIATNGKKIALSFEFLNRLTIDGNTGELPLKGPETGIRLPKRAFFPSVVGPRSTAFSPDGKILYMTGYAWQSAHNGTGAGSVMAVLKLNYESNEPYSVFVGEKDNSGKDEKHFDSPTSVDTDKNGNVYVSDLYNDRVQIFDSSGNLIKSISVKQPTKVCVHQKTGEVFVFSWGVKSHDTKPGKITIFSSLPDVAQKHEDVYQFMNYSYYTGINTNVVLDSWVDEPTIWVVFRDGGSVKKLQIKNGKWKVVTDLANNAKKDILRIGSTAHNIQQLFFNHKNEKLYVGEPDSGPTGKAWTQLIEIDPETSKSKLIPLPINPQDMAFDYNGYVYLRTLNVLTRFDMSNWKEIPFDYGEERQSVGKDGGMGGASSPVISALMLPAQNAVCYHQGGISVNTFGDIAVACHNGEKPSNTNGEPIQGTANYRPPGYPGRIQTSTSVCVHIWDKHGKVKEENTIKGIPQTDGIQLDRENNIYMLATPARMIDGKRIDDGMSSTMIKFDNKYKGKFTTADESPIVLPVSQYPNRNPELEKKVWVDEYEWMYGGCGFAGFTTGEEGGGCACWFVRFKLDRYARTFVPEPMQYKVAVLDSAGNLILKVGKYGNEDSKGKNSKEPLGGDEVGLFHPCFVEVHSDHRLFISDIGNDKILSVKLKYEVNEVIPLKK